MRITNTMMAENTLRNISKAANRLASANASVASNKKIQLASDDPVVATRAVTYRSYVSQIKQYQDNASAAKAWQKATDDALSELTDIIQSARELTNQAASDTMSEENRAEIKTNIESLYAQAVAAMNTTYAGRYVFGGYSTSEAPYETTTTTIGETVTLKGDYLSLGSVVSSAVSDSDILDFYSANSADLYDDTTADQNIVYNIGFNREVTVNIEGQDVTGSSDGNLFDTFSKLLLALDGDTSYKSVEVDAGGTATVATKELDLSSLLDEFSADLDRMLVSQATLGARMDSVTSAVSSLSDSYTTYKALMSDNEDVDTAEAATELASAEYTYQAALAVGAKVISKSLIDYIA